MRLSCNGCRILRKGCSEDCSIKPCLEWIKTSDAQANATVFLAKFYGRAGLVNLIDAAPPQLRPAVFKSLLHEACGRVVNPVYGSVGLAWSGNWALCQDALEAVLRGDPITKIAAADAADSGPPLKACDIRHVKKGDGFSGSYDLNRVRNRCRFKRAAAKAKRSPVVVVETCHERGNRSPSQGSSVSHRWETAEAGVMERGFRHSESLGSAETAEPEPSSAQGLANDGEIELELGLCLEPSKRCAKLRESKPRETGDSADAGRLELRLHHPDSS